MFAVMLRPPLQELLKRDAPFAFQLACALEVRRRDRAEAIDRTPARGSERLQRGLDSLRVVVPLASQLRAVDVGKDRIALTQNPDDASLVSFDIDVAQMKHVLPQRKLIRRGLERQPFLVLPGNQTAYPFRSLFE